MIYKLKDLATIKRGSSPRPISDFIVEFGYPWLKIADFSLHDRFVYETKEFIKPEGLKNTKYVKKGTLVVTNSATPGIPIFLGKDMCLHDGFLYFEEVSPKVDLEYLYYFILFSRKKLVGLGNGSIFVNLKKEILENYEIDLPPIEQQKKIAAVLLSLDNKIQANNKSSELYHDYCSLIFQKMNALGKEGTLGSLISVVETGKRPKGGALTSGVPSVGAEKIKRFGIYDYSSEKYISHDYFANLKKGVMKDYDVLLYKDGAYTGNSSMCLDDFPHKECAVNEHVFILRTSNNFAPFYLYFQIADSKNKQYIFKVASSKAAQPGLNKPELLSTPVLLNKKEDITKFENDVAPFMHLIASNA